MNTFKTILGLSLFFLLTQCSKTTTTTTDPVWVDSNAATEVLSFFKTNAPPFQTFTIDAASGGSVTKDSIQVNFLPNSFMLSNGNPYTGAVTVKMQTIGTVAEQIYSGVTTMAGNGTLLLSDGMFKIEALDNAGNPLSLKPGKKYDALFEKVNTITSQQVFKGNNVNGTSTGSNSVRWDTWDSSATNRGKSGGAAITGLDTLFKYVNLDRFMTGTLTDITVNTPAGFTNSNTECMLRYVGEKACAYIPSNFALKAFSTKSPSHYKVQLGGNVKIFLAAKKDGKFYFAEQTITSITADQTISFTALTEKTEAELKAAISNF